MCLRIACRGSRSVSLTSAYSGPSSSRSCDCAVLARLRICRTKRPAWRANSGRRSGPNTITATKAMTASSGRPIPNTPSALRGGTQTELHAGQAAAPAGEGAGDRVEHPGAGGGRVGLDDRLADAAPLAQAHVDRDLAQPRHVVAEAAAEGGRHPGAAAGAEDLQPVLLALVRAVRAGEEGHVLDD